MKDTGIYSTYQRDSNPEHSAYQRHNSNEDPDTTLRNLHADNVDMITTPGNVDLYGFTNANFQIEDKKASVSPYSANITNHDTKLSPPPITTKEKSDDRSSTESNFCNSSIHESQSSRRSLTNKR
jgi:hypothetical protein